MTPDTRIPISGRTRLMGIIGDPVHHSKSPALLNAAFEATSLDYRMLAMKVDANDVGAAVAGLRSLGVEGCSVTMPHKASVIEHLDECSTSAALLNAVNCIRREGDRLIGENTDGAGFLRGLHADTGFAPDGRRCVVVGAGGAARAVSLALVEGGASEVIVVNRTHAAAEVVAELSPDRISVGAVTDIAHADLVVQATSVGMGDDDSSAVEPTLFGTGQVLADLIYHPPETPTMRAARGAGATVSNGLSMLLYQAGVAFELWTGVEAPIAKMRAAVGP